MSRSADKYQRMRIFVALAQQGSFQGAARALNLKPPTVSKAIQLLEKDLGCSLVVRNTRGMALTETGQGYFEQAKTLVEAIDELEATTRQSTGQPQGKLRVTAPVAFGEWVLGPLLPKFLKQYPEIELNLFLTDQVHELRGQGFDVGIRALRKLNNSDYFYIPLRSLSPKLVASPDYLASRPAINSPEDLQGHEFIVHQGAHQLFNRWQLSKGNETFQFQAKGRYVANHIHVSIEAAMQGLGILNTYSHYVADKIERHDLEEVLPDYTQSDVVRFAFYHQRRSFSRKLDVFLTFLEQNLGQH